MHHSPDILLVHAHDAAWDDLISALGAAHMRVQGLSSAAQIQLRMRNQPPDVVLLNGEFEGGIDLLLKTKQTAHGIGIIIVRKLRGGEALYAATLPGSAPRHLGPTSPQLLAGLLRDSLVTPLPPTVGGSPRHDQGKGTAMTIVAIDDDQVCLAVLTWILKQDGHRVIARSNPLEAVHDIQPGVDLVISDVNMPGMDGFEVAQLVVSRLGVTPPRILLMSGENHHARVDGILPDQLIGLVDKPISLEHMHRVVRLIAQSREVCPGILGTNCPRHHGSVPSRGEVSDLRSRFCRSGSYSQCPHYNQHGGKALRAAVKGSARSSPRR
jgi:DNA-binding NtrC family response regulator